MAEFGFPKSPAEGFVGYPLESPTVHVDLLAASERVVQLRFTAVTAGVGSRTLRLTGASGELSLPFGPSTQVTAAVQVPSGRSRVTLTVEPQDVSGENAVELSAPWTEEAAGATPVLAAEPLPEADAS
jgi:hypothetical protein